MMRSKTDAEYRKMVEERRFVPQPGERLDEAAMAWAAGVAVRRAAEAHQAVVVMRSASVTRKKGFAQVGVVMWRVAGENHVRVHKVGMLTPEPEGGTHWPYAWRGEEFVDKKEADAAFDALVKEGERFARVVLGA